MSTRPRVNCAEICNIQASTFLYWLTKCANSRVMQTITRITTLKLLFLENWHRYKTPRAIKAIKTAKTKRIMLIPSDTMISALLTSKSSLFSSVFNQLFQEALIAGVYEKSMYFFNKVVTFCKLWELWDQTRVWDLTQYQLNKCQRWWYEIILSFQPFWFFKGNIT